MLHYQAAVDIVTKLDRNSDSEFVPIKVKSLTNLIRKIQVSVIDPQKFPTLHSRIPIKSSHIPQSTSFQNFVGIEISQLC